MSNRPFAPNFKLLHYAQVASAFPGSLHWTVSGAEDLGPPANTTVSEWHCHSLRVVCHPGVPAPSICFCFWDAFPLCFCCSSRPRAGPTYSTELPSVSLSSVPPAMVQFRVAFRHVSQAHICLSERGLSDVPGERGPGRITSGDERTARWRGTPRAGCSSSASPRTLDAASPSKDSQHSLPHACLPAPVWPLQLQIKPDAQSQRSMPTPCLPPPRTGVSLEDDVSAFSNSPGVYSRVPSSPHRNKDDVWGGAFVTW